jgi:hypothetical protein
MRSPYGNKKPRRLTDDPEFLRGVVDGLRFLAAGIVSTAQRSLPKKAPVIRYKKRRRIEVPHG